MVNEAAVTLAWLKNEVGLSNQKDSLINEVWNRISGRMRNQKQNIIGLQHWSSDYWICKGAKVEVYFCTKWTPPDNLDDWPLHQIPIDKARPTNHATFQKLLSEATIPEGYDSNEAVYRFYALDDATKERGDLAMLQAQHVRAWLFTALGPLLMSIPLSPQNDTDLLISETIRRVKIPGNLKVSHLVGIQFSEGDLEVLYNCRQNQSGTLSINTTQAGQGNEWMKHWQWLSRPISVEDALPPIQMAAQLLRSGALVKGLLSALELRETALEEVAVAVMRRMLLALKAMAWLEHALQAIWTTIRPQDLSCLAYSALKPEWPRRLVSVSHRSFEVKPLLQATFAWNSPLFAIDAIYVPAWETNTAMIWGLFANTPVIAQVDSPHYLASEWCQREGEMIKYLEKECDFRSDRVVTTIKPEQVASFNAIHENWYLEQGKLYDPLLSRLTSFPPLSQVYIPWREEEWKLSMLRVAGALRLFYTNVYNPTIVNQLAEAMLIEDFDIPFLCFTNNPRGWAEYKMIFSEFSEFIDDIPFMHMGLPDNTPLLSAEEIQEFSDRIPDLSSGKIVLGDVLVALEWVQSLLPILEEANLSDMILIDLRGVSKDTWETDPGYSLARGIASLRMPPRPVWFIQLAGQNIEQWDLVGGDLPIFTQHTIGQYNWMFEGGFSPDWPKEYMNRCGLLVSNILLEKCQ